MNESLLPTWSLSVLCAPGTRMPLRLDGAALVGGDGPAVGLVEEGIARFGNPSTDKSINFYQEVGGAHFYERSRVAFAMTTLDTPVYHGYLDELRTDSQQDDVVVDVGGGDGRNAEPWLQWGHRRVVVIDAVHAALARFRARIAANRPEWLDRVLLVEADIRSLPLANSCAARVAAIESLAYLNEEYTQGLEECARILTRTGRLLVADRDYEAGLVMRALYFGGLAGSLEHANTRDLWDGIHGRLVRSRCFTAAEFSTIVRAAGFHIEAEYGVSALSLIFSFLRGIDRLRGDESRLNEVHVLLRKLGREGNFRRSHVIVASAV